jgi:hypothetical protein
MKIKSAIYSLLTRLVRIYLHVNLTKILLVLGILMTMQLHGQTVPCFGDVVDYNPSNPGPIGDDASWSGLVWQNGTNCVLAYATCDRWWYDPPTTTLFHCTLTYEEETGMYCHTTYVSRTRIGNDGTPWTAYNPSNGKCDFGCKNRYD